MFTTEDLSQIVILDFGISQIYKQSNPAKVFGLTPNYCPPEIVLHKASTISPKSDIFSFGMLIILFIMVF